MKEKLKQFISQNELRYTWIIDENNNPDVLLQVDYELLKTFNQLLINENPKIKDKVFNYFVYKDFIKVFMFELLDFFNLELEDIFEENEYED